MESEVAGGVGGYEGKWREEQTLGFVGRAYDRRKLKAL